MRSEALSRKCTRILHVKHEYRSACGCTRQSIGRIKQPSLVSEEEWTHPLVDDLNSTAEALHQPGFSCCPKRLARFSSWSSLKGNLPAFTGSLSGPVLEALLTYGFFLYQSRIRSISILDPVTTSLPSRGDSAGRAKDCRKITFYKIHNNSRKPYLNQDFRQLDLGLQGSVKLSQPTARIFTGISISISPTLGLTAIVPGQPLSKSRTVLL